MDDHADQIRAAFERIVADAPEPPELPDAAAGSEAGTASRTQGLLVAAVAAVVVLVAVGAVVLVRSVGSPVAPGTGPISTTELGYVDTTEVAPSTVDSVDVAFVVDPALDVASWEVHLEPAVEERGMVTSVVAGDVAAARVGDLPPLLRGDAPGVIVAQGLRAGVEDRILDALAMGTPIPGLALADHQGTPIEFIADRLFGVVVTSNGETSTFVSPRIDDALGRQAAWFGIRVLMGETGRLGRVTGAEAVAIRALAVDDYGRPDFLEERWRRLAGQACLLTERREPLDPVVEQLVGEGFDAGRASSLSERIVEIACPEEIPWQQLAPVAWGSPRGFAAAAVAEMPVKVPPAPVDPEVDCCASPPFETGIPLGPDDLTDADRRLVREAAAPMLEVGDTPPPYTAYVLFRDRRDLVVVLEGGDGFRRAFTVRREGDGLLTEILAQAGKPSYTFGDRSMRIVWVDVPVNTAWVSLTTVEQNTPDARQTIQLPYARAVFFAVDEPSYDQYIQLFAQDASGEVLGGVELLVDGGGCSGRGLNPEVDAQPGLPEPVAETRAAIARAAATCDVATLAGLAADPNGFFFWVETPPTAQDLADHDRRTGELRRLYETLRTPFGVRSIADAEGRRHDVYLWPSAAAYDRFEDIPAGEWARTEAILGDLDERQFADSGFIDFRVGIRADGLWSFALAGE